MLGFASKREAKNICSRRKQHVYGTKAKRGLFFQITEFSGARS